jgi:predicted N-acetyltransferase YhbS
MSDFVIKQIDATSPEYEAVCQLREEILRKPLGLALTNDDMRPDTQDMIFIALKSNDVIGCVLLHPVDDKIIKLRQMAVAALWQGKGVGRLLVAAAEKVAEEKGYIKIVLHARKAALGFYETLIYKITGDAFTEVGIPHFAMEKEFLKSW